MPLTCLVVNCGKRSNRDNVHFYSVPAILNNKFLTHKNELSAKRRALWIAALKRDDLSEAKLKNQRVCSEHFITGMYFVKILFSYHWLYLQIVYCILKLIIIVSISGKPAALEDVNHPDWVPSQKMGHSSINVRKREEDVDRKMRVDNRKRQRLEAIQVLIIFFVYDIEMVIS